MPSIELEAPAKINLFLHITGRANAYHLIHTLFQKVTLLDHITLDCEHGERKIELSCPDSSLSCGPDNLVYRAAVLFMEAAMLDLDVRIRLRKKIPVGGGLGGGSSDAAAVLKGLNQLAGSPLSDKTLHKLACRLGADVPFFMLPDSSAIGTGIGTELEPVATQPYWYVLVCPDFGISSAWVYSTFKLTTLKQETILDAGLASQAAKWRNDLEQAVIPRYPVIAGIKAELMAFGAQVSLMSGSGSTVFGVFPTRKNAAEAARLLEVRRDWRIYIVTAY